MRVGLRAPAVTTPARPKLRPSSSLAGGANGTPPCRVPASSADGPHSLGGLPILRAGAVRGCSHFALSPTTPSRAAVIAAGTRGGLTLSAAHGLTAVPAHNPSRSAGRAAHTLNADHHTATDAAHPADLTAAFAVPTSHSTNRITTTTKEQR